MKRVALGALACALGLSTLVHAQGQGAAIHGANSVFTTGEVVMVWAVLRAAAEDDAEVVIRLVAPRFAALTVEAVDPFGGGRRLVVPRQPLSGAAEVRRRRADFAEFPRLEVHVHPAAGAAAPGPLTIYYLGVPDTTPEFTSEAALRRYLEDAVAKAHRAR
jgi:hypothetical protein